MSRAALLLTLLCAAPACLAEEPGIEIEEVAEGEYLISVDRAAFVGAGRVEDQQWPHQAVTDPCQCNTAACVAAWADDNLACNVCITVVCDGQPGAHACSHCAQ